jgi:hypothetical protein
MRIAKNDFARKMSLYTEGQQGEGGPTLQRLSVESKNAYGNYPLYNIYRAGYALLGDEEEGDDPGQFDGNPTELYADTIVQDLFLLNVTHIEAEAAVIMNVYMAFYGSLYDMLEACDRNKPAAMNAALDKAVAYYIGAEQVKGDDQFGFFLYNLAQFVGEKFNQNQGDSEVLVNKNILGGIFKLQGAIQDGTCASPEGYGTLRKEVRSIMGHLNTALVQMMIFRTLASTPGVDTDFVELYALALFPQIASCNSDAYYDLVDQTIANNVDNADAQNQVIATLQSAYSCLLTSCASVGAYEVNRVPACVDDPVAPLAAYQPRSDVRAISYMDRDIRQIRWMLDVGSFEAAVDYYTHGWNGAYSLRDIATNELDGTTSRDYLAIADFYGDDPGVTMDALIQQVLLAESPFDQASTIQRKNMLDGFFKGPLMYLATTTLLETAIDACNAATFDGEMVESQWDSAVAFFIGSTEGSDDGPGDSLWGLADTYCEFFGDCEPEDAQINERLLGNFVGAREGLANQACDQISDIYNEDIRPDLLVAMIQGTLYHYIQWSTDSSGADAGYVYAFSRILGPLFLDGAHEASEDVESLNLATDFSLTRTQPTQKMVLSVFLDLSNIMISFPTDCADVGAVLDAGMARGVCEDGTNYSAPPVPAPPAPEPTAAPTLGDASAILTPTRAPASDPKDIPPEHPEGRGFGRYDFFCESCVKAGADMVYGIKDMWTSSSVTEAQAAYVNSQYVPQGLQGYPALTNIQTLATEADSIMGDDLLWNVFLYARYDDDAFDGELATNDDFWPWGDDVVTLALDPEHGNSVKLASEAAVVMNIYMMIVHHVYEATRLCREGNADAPKHIDAAFGLWIGEEQGEAAFDSGWSMYSIGQEAYNHYGNDEDEAPANSAIIGLMHGVNQLAQECTGVDGDPNYVEMRAATDDIIFHLSKPLMQMLLYYLSVGDVNFAELYSLALVPQIRACNDASFEYLGEVLFQGTFFDESDADTETVLDDFAGGLACLRYSCEDLGDTTNANDNLKSIVVRLCNDLQDDFDPAYLASYEVSRDDDAHTAHIQEFARLDLDLHQLNILLRTEALVPALDLFEFGRNSRGSDTSGPYRSLKDLMSDPIRQDAGVLSAAYESYFGADLGAQHVSTIIGRQGGYSSASRTQLAEAVTRTIQTVGTHPWIVAKLIDSIEACREVEAGSSDELDKASEYIDQAVALFVGSIEGSSSGGSLTDSGKFLMALGKEVCDRFGTCATQGDSTVNELILFDLSDMKEWFETSNCASAEKILKGSLLPMLPVSMIQASLAFAADAAGSGAGSPAEILGSLDGVFRSIIPLVAAFDEDDADTLSDNVEFDLSRAAVVDGIDVVFDIVASSLREMGVDCNAIGTLDSTGLSTCERDDEAPPAPDSPTTLGDDKYTSTTYVQDRADIALDVKQMRDALNVGNANLARTIYNDGENSPIYSDDGVELGVRSLQSFSVSATQTMASNPLFQISVFALRDSAGAYLGASAGQFADSIVRESFDKGGELAVDAAVALNLWMEAVNELFETLANCRNQQLKDDDGIHSMDEVAAYWLGDGKPDGQFENGHLLYALGETMGKNFDTVGDDGQADANTNLLQLLQQAKLELSFPDACSEDVATVRRIRHVVNLAVSQMTVPLMQALINHIIFGDKDRVRVYAHAIVPLLAACSPVNFAFLKDKLIDNSYSATEIDSIVLALQNSYGCLGLTCDDIGFHVDSELDIDCVQDNSITPLAGFHSRTDAGEYAQLDLDIQELDILMAMEAYDAAEELYRFGKHAATGLDNGKILLSLESVARDAGRSRVPEFLSFEQFFQNDANYADTIIRNTFSPLNQELNSLQKRYVAVGTAQYMVMYMGALQAMQDSVSACEKDSQDRGASEHWDRAAAYIIGHMEGADNGGSREGRLLWGLAKRVCEEFSTCSTTVEGSSLADEKILSLLYTGRGALTSGSCPALRDAVSEIRSSLRVPLIQGAISMIVKVDETTGAQKERHHAEAHALSMALLPLIAAKNRDRANTISSNLDFADSPLSSGLTTVVDAFTASIGDLEVDCTDVGVSVRVDACSGKVSGGVSVGIFLVIAVVVVSIATLAIAFLIYRKRARKKLKEAPVFVPNEKGEMSHHEVFSTSSSRMSAGEVMHSDADAAHDEDFDHQAQPPEAPIV